jgi:hypothetical protein
VNDSGSARAAERWLVWVTEPLCSPSAGTSHNRPGSDSSTAAGMPRRWADRRHGVSGLRETEGTRFSTGMCASFFGLDDSEGVRLNKHAMDVDTAETLVGARLIRQAAVKAWAAADRAGAESPEQLFASGVDLAAEQARHLVRDGTDVDGSMPDGDGPVGLLSPAELLLRRLAPIGASDAFHDLRATVVDLVGEAKPVSAGEGRMVEELLDDSDGLAHKALLDMSPGWAPRMVRGWPQPSCGPCFHLPRRSQPMVVRSLSWPRWAARLAPASPQRTEPVAAAAQRCRVLRAERDRQRHHARPRARRRGRNGHRLRVARRMEQAWRRTRPVEPNSRRPSSTITTSIGTVCAGTQVENGGLKLRHPGGVWGGEGAHSDDRGDGVVEQAHRQQPHR